MKASELKNKRIKFKLNEKEYDLKFPSTLTIQTIFTNKKYTGNVTLGKIYTTDFSNNN